MISVLPSETWRIQDVYQKAQIVVFRRKGSDTLAAIENYVRHLLEGDIPLEPLPPSRLLEWLHMCRSIGWHFEATVLYERAHPAPDQWNESDACTAEMIYNLSRASGQPGHQPFTSRWQPN